jgi:hypothetical protein
LTQEEGIDIPIHFMREPSKTSTIIFAIMLILAPFPVFDEYSYKHVVTSSFIEVSPVPTASDYKAGLISNRAAVNAFIDFNSILFTVPSNFPSGRSTLGG